MKRKFVQVFTFILLIGWTNLMSQETDLLLIKKGKSFEQKDNMIKSSPTGFYMYKNVLYDIQVKSCQKK